MVKAAIRLPEKSYFSIVEIAMRWSTSSEHVMHYLTEGDIRAAILTRKMPERLWLKGHESHFSSVRDVKFLYVTPDKFQQSFTDVTVGEVEDLEGRVFQIYGAFDETERYSLNFVDYFRTTSESQLMWSQESVIITREERDRFERENKIVVEGQAPQPASSYSTPYLEIMHQAIAEFFEPRRSRDPKKDEVVSWINERLIERGLGKSGNAAGTMFTIIKPTDHNPRKEKG